MTTLNEQDYVFDHQIEPRLNTMNSTLKNKLLQQMPCLKNGRQSTTQQKIKHSRRAGFIKNLVRLLSSYKKPTI